MEKLRIEYHENGNKYLSEIIVGSAKEVEKTYYILENLGYNMKHSNPPFFAKRQGAMYAIIIPDGAETGRNDNNIGVSVMASDTALRIIAGADVIEKLCD